MTDCVACDSCVSVLRREVHQRGRDIRSGKDSHVEAGVILVEENLRQLRVCAPGILAPSLVGSIVLVAGIACGRGRDGGDRELSGVVVDDLLSLSSGRPAYTVLHGSVS